MSSVPGPVDYSILIRDLTWHAADSALAMLIALRLMPDVMPSESHTTIRTRRSVDKTVIYAHRES